MRLETIVDVFNSTTTPLGVGETFTGQWSDTRGFGGITVGLKTDANGKVYVDFSPDGVNADSSIEFDVDSGIRETHRLTISNKFYRVRAVNDGSAQTYMRLQTMLGWPVALSSPLNQAVQLDADAQTTRMLDPEIAVARGLFTGISYVNNFGRNSDVDSGTVPEDIWNGGGVYTGFPTGAAEEFQVFSSNAGDTGTLTFTYLASATATYYSTATVTLQGTTQVNTGITGIRMHTAQYSSGAATTFNLGTITIRHRTTTANVFCQMPIGRSQTNSAAYTVPFGNTAYLNRLFVKVIGSVNGTVSGALWVRDSGGSPRLRRPFSATQADRFEERIEGGLVLPALTDVMIRIYTATNSGMDVIGAYDLTVVENND